MKLSDYPEKLRPFVFHGMQLPPPTKCKGTVSIDCPFCDKAGHFFMNSDTGQWSCKRCTHSGNIYGFLDLLLNESIAATSPKEYEALAEDRKVTVTDLQAFKVCRSVLTGEWIIPTYNANQALNNLYRWAVLTGSSDSNGLPNGNEAKLMGTPTCKAGIFGSQFFDSKRHTKLDVVEGLWDTIAMYGIHNTVSERKGKYMLCRYGADSCLHKTNVGVIGVPGSGTFQEDWLEYFPNRTVSLIFDNDHPKRDKNGNVRIIASKPVCPGWDGMQRILKLIRKTGTRPKKLYLIHWGDDTYGDIPPKDTEPVQYSQQLPDGYDVRDMITSMSKPTEFYQAIVERLKAASLKGKGVQSKADEPDPVEPLECTSIEELTKHYANKLHLTSSIRRTLAVALSVVVSTELGGDQLWFRIIGPPGCGKTTLAENFSVAREYCMPKSVLTGFHSGFTANDGKQRDASLIPHMRNKTVIVKDADTLIQASNRDKILSELRDIYDKVTRAHYRNEVQYEHSDLHVTFLLCGTDALRKLNRTFLGERFLDIEMIDDKDDTSPFIERSRTNTYAAVVSGLLNPASSTNHNSSSTHPSSSSAPHSRARSSATTEPDTPTPAIDDALARYTYGFIKYIKDKLPTIPPPKMSGEVGRMIDHMAPFLASMRAAVEREGHEIAFRARADLATRITAQLTKLSVCLALVFQLDSIDDSVMQIVWKVVRDSARGFRLEVVEYLMERGPATISQLEVALRLPQTSGRRVVSDLEELGMVKRMDKNNNSGQRGRNVHMFELTDYARTLYTEAQAPLEGVRIETRTGVRKSTKRTQPRAPNPRVRKEISKVNKNRKVTKRPVKKKSSRVRK